MVVRFYLVTNRPPEARCYSSYNMHRRLVRVSLVLIMLAVTAGAVYNLFQIQQQIEDDREVERAFVSRAALLSVEVTDLRAAQHAYVAAGQDPGYWVKKGAARMTDIAGGLQTLTQLAQADPTTEVLEEARSLMERLARVDSLAREHTTSRQDLMASDLIFTDGLEISTLVTRQLDLAQIREREAYTRSHEQHRKGQMVALAGSIATGLVVALLLVPVPAAPRQTQDLERSKDSDPSALVAPDAVAPPARPTAPSDTDVVIASPHHEELQWAAELCTDLGRLTDPEQLPPLLDRAAKLLHASGIIVWVRDASGTGLRPAIAHGYSDDVLAQLGSVACSSDNAAASAYRTRRLQVVPVGSDSRGALVAPLLGPDECIGVIAAEVRAGWESSADVQATAAILAAQFATVVTADPGVENALEAERAQQG